MEENTMKKENNVDLFYQKFNEMLLICDKFLFKKNTHVSETIWDLRSCAYLECLLDLYQDYVKSCFLDNKEDIAHYENIIFSKNGKIHHDLGSLIGICRALNKDILFKNGYLLSLPSMEVKEENGKKYFKCQETAREVHGFTFMQISRFCNMYDDKTQPLFDEMKNYQRQGIANQNVMKIKMKLDYIYYDYRKKFHLDFL